MSDWVIFPWNVLAILTIGILSLLVLYFAQIPRKSTESRTLLGWLVVVTILQASNSLENIAGNSAWSNPWVSANVWDQIGGFAGPLTGALFMLFAYQLGSVRFEREAKWVMRFVLPIVVMSAVLDVYEPFGESSEMWAEIIDNVVAAWSLIVLLRKWRISKVDSADPQTTSYWVFPLLFSLPMLIGILLFPLLSSMGLGGANEFIGEFFLAAFPILIGLLFLQFTPDPTSLEAKFVGAAFLVVVVVTQLLTAPFNTFSELWTSYAAPLEPETIEFIPDGDGGYTLEGSAPVFYVPGSQLDMADDTTVVVASQFPLLLYGVAHDSLYINSNGFVGFEARQDEFVQTRNFYQPDIPTIGAFTAGYQGNVFADLDPSEAGSVHYDSTPDSIMVTWKGVAVFDRDKGLSANQRILNSQIVLRKDGSFQLNRGETSHRFRNWKYGISPGQNRIIAAGVHPDSTEWSGFHGRLKASHLPISIGRDEFIFAGERNAEKLESVAVTKAFDILNIVFWLSLTVLTLIPLFFRLAVKRRMTELMNGLERVKGGDIGDDIPVAMMDEVGQMTSAFNHMSGSLRKYNDEMESLVDERTAELKATQAQLVEQEKLASLGSLTAGIAHEIKNPLNFVNNFAEVGGELTDELSEAIAAGRADEAQSILAEMKTNSEQITKHGRRADDIVKSMMQHARGGASEMETVSVNTFLEEYANLAWHGRRAKDDGFQAELIRDFSDDVGSLKVMPQELGRVVLNLLNNAFDAVRSTEGAEVIIGTRPAAGAIEIFVSDNGPGIPDDIREKIFEPFFTTKATGEGTGLGLSLSYDIITKGHGGKMVATKSSQGGAQFTITLPGATHV